MMNRNIRTIIIVALIVGLVLGLSSISDRRDSAGAWVNHTIRVEMVNGISRVVTVAIPPYANMVVRGSRGSYYISSWKYCMFKGLARCGFTVMNGVVYFEYAE